MGGCCFLMFSLAACYHPDDKQYLAILRCPHRCGRTKTFHYDKSSHHWHRNAMRNSLLSKPPARGRRGVPRQRPTSESESETKGGGRMSCAHTSQHLLKMLRFPLRSASASSPSRIHWFTTGHTARKSLGLSVFCFINSSVSWDPRSWVGVLCLQ